MGIDDYEAWRDLMEVLEERDAEWCAEQGHRRPRVTLLPIAPIGVDSPRLPGPVLKAGHSRFLDLDVRSSVIGAPTDSGGDVL